MLLDDQPPLPPRYDPLLGVGAITGVIALIVFLITQFDHDLRVHGNVRFAIVQWCLNMSVPCFLCWLLRPRVGHLAYALKLGRALAVLPDAPDDIPSRRGCGSRRWFWYHCGTICACTWTLAATADIAAATRLLNMPGVNLSVVTFLLCQIGNVCAVARIVGPSLATVDDIYDLAREHAEPRAKVYDFKSRTHQQ